MTFEQKLPTILQIEGKLNYDITMIGESLNVLLQILDFNTHHKGMLFLTTSKSSFACMIHIETGLEY